jgi:hypothetical protein
VINLFRCVDRRAERFFWAPSLLFCALGFWLLFGGLAASAPALASKAPIAAYSFDEGKGKTAHDSAGTHDGTVEGAEWTEAGKFGSALKFDGEGGEDCVSIPDSPELRLQNEFTLEAWVKPEGTDESNPVIFKTTEYFFGYTLFLGLSHGENRPEGAVAYEPFEATEVSSGEAVPTNAWSSLALTYDGEHLRLYENGELLDSTEGEGAISSEGDLLIGCARPWEDGFTGLIDNLRIYNRALDPEEMGEDEETAVGEEGEGPVLAGFEASISGEPQEGEPLVADFGSWTGEEPVTFDYQWESCNAEGAACEAITGARRRTYWLGSSDAGHTIRVTVAAQPGPMATVRSEPTSVVIEEEPRTQGTPLVYGHIAVGRTISTQMLEWRPEAASITYQWRRCDATGSECEDISGATAQHYDVQAADIGSTLEVHESATSTGGTGSVTSEATELVSAPAIANTSIPYVTESASQSGTLLTAHPGTWSGAEVAFHFQWERCDKGGGECADLPEENEATFRPRVDEVGSSYRVRVEARNPSDAETATSSATGAFEEAEPIAVEAPSILGTARAGRALEAEQGRWNGLGPAESSLQWLRCNAGGEACEAIAEATDGEYELSSEDTGSTIRLEVTLENEAGSAFATSVPTAVVSAPSGSGPVLEEAPSITGETEVGSQLTASSGIWSGAVEYGYQWQRCDSSGQQCEPIERASEETYELTTDDIGSAIAVQVTAEGEDEGAGLASAGTGQSVRSVGGPANVSAPALEGVAQEGETLTVERGIWEGGEPISFAYQWQRCDAGACNDIEGASEESYEVTGQDVMHSVRAVVTAQNEAGETTAVSASTSPVGSRAPFDETAPTLSGGARTGDMLTAEHGTWQGDPTISFTYRWLRCDSAGMSCEEVAEAEGSSYELTGADTGTTIRVSVEASNSKGEAQANSEPTAPISDSGGPVPLDPPAITGTYVTGETITAASGKWEGAEGFSYQWQRCDIEPAGADCVNIAGAIGASYTIAPADTEFALRVVTLASGPGGTAFALSKKTEGIESRPLTAPKNTKLPMIEGTVNEFQTLSVDPGVWKSPYPVSYRYQWLRCNPSGGQCAPIQGAASSVYTPEWAEVGGTLRVVVIGSSEAGGRAVTTAPSAEVTRAPPSNLEPPSIYSGSGEIIDQETIFGEPGSWQGDELNLSWHWEACNAEGKACEAAPGEAESYSYDLSSSLVGHTLRVWVTATNEAGSASEVSAPTEVVLPRAPELGGLPPEISGEAFQDGTLEGYAGWWHGTPVLAFSYQWQRCDNEGKECKDIAGATKATYVAAAADVGSRLRLEVEASSEYGSAKASSEPSEVIAPPLLPQAGSPGPSIEGMPYVGRELTAKPGTWTGHAPISFAYQWQRCSKEGKECKNISGASEATYLITAADLSATIRANVTGSNSSGTGSEVSAASKAIAEAKVANVSVPTLSGKNQVGSALEASTGSWSGSGPLEFAYEWQRCSSSGKECKGIEGASKVNYTLQSADGRKTVRVVVTATGALGSATASSTTQSILPEKSTNTTSPAISGTQLVGNTLTASPGEWTPEPDKFSYQWQRCSEEGSGCFNLEGQTKATYTPQYEDREKTLRVRVTAENTGESESPAAFSAVTSVISSSYPTILEAPILSTTEPVAEQEVSTTPGVWSGIPTISYSYQWQHCFYPFSFDCFDIPGATESSYVPEETYAGQNLRVEVRATNGYGWNEEASSISGQIGEGSPPPPESTSPPTIEGVPVVGGPLRVNPGTWNGASFWGYEWQQCDGEGEECVAIAQETGEEYVPSRGDVGHTFKVVVTGYGNGQAVETTEPSESVGEASKPSSESLPTIEGGAEIGETLTAKGGTWSGSPTIRSSFVWVRCNSSGGNCEVVSDPFGVEWLSSHEVSNADAGHTLRLRETVTNGWGSVTAMSKATSIVPPAPALANLGLPEMAFGEPGYGFSYWASPGEWTGVPSFEWQWERCDPLTFDPEDESLECADIPGATANEIDPSAADVGYKLRLKLTANSGKESATVYSKPTSAWVGVGVSRKKASLEGLAVPGQTITAHSGLVSEAAELPNEIDYRFWRLSGEGPEEVQDGPSPEYEIQEADVGSEIEVEMTLSVWRADKAFVVEEGSSSASTPEVEALPTNDALPAISGEATAGATLEAEAGEWHGGGGGPLNYAFQWRRCDEEGESCKDIPGATTLQYTLLGSDVGSTLKVSVTAFNGPVSEVAESDLTEVVQAAEAPANEAPPVVTGEPIEIQTLEAERGEWIGSEPLSFSYQWQGCEPGKPASCLDIEGATESTLRLDRTVVGQSLRVIVVASNAAGESTSASELTEAVEAAPPPVPTEAPSISVLGPPAEGSTVMTNGGSWENADSSEYQYKWLRCDPEGEGCEEVEGADNPSYELGEEDVGFKMQVEVIAANFSQAVSATSELSPEIGESMGSAESKMVYLSPDRQRVYLSSLEGESPKEIANCESLVGKEDCRLYAPKISPNQELIALEVRESKRELGEGAIFLMNFDGSEARLFAEGSEPSWSSDGTELFLTTIDPEEPKEAQVVMAHADGSDGAEPAVIFQPKEMEGSPDISSGGEEIAYSASGPSKENEEGWIEQNREIYIAKLGSSPKRLELGPRVREAFDPKFTPDGKQIVFDALLTDLPGYGPSDLAYYAINQLWVVNSNGADPHPVGPVDSVSYGPPSVRSGEILVDFKRVTELDFGGGSTLRYSAPGILRFALDPNTTVPLNSPVSGIEPDSMATASRQGVDRKDCPKHMTACARWSEVDRQQAAWYGRKWAREENEKPQFNPAYRHVGSNCTNFVSQAWHKAGQVFMDEWSRDGETYPNRWWANAAGGESKEQMLNDNYNWENADGFHGQQLNSDRARDMGHLPAAAWQDGDVVLLNWRSSPAGDEEEEFEVFNHSIIVTAATKSGRFVSSETEARNNIPWSRYSTKIVDEFFEKGNHDEEFPYGWTWEVIRPIYKASNLG